MIAWVIIPVNHTNKQDMVLPKVPNEVGIPAIYCLSGYFRKTITGKDGKIKKQKEPDLSYKFRLRYGCNPHQDPAYAYMKNGDPLPFQILSSAPGYINLLDALNAWQLVRELKQATSLPAAASFKHVSPSGAAVAIPFSDILKKVHFVDNMELSPLAAAYARARGVDRMSSFGDWIALSEPMDVPTAKLISHEVSDGVIAPAYEPEALEILKKKKQGKYIVLQIDLAYQPDLTEARDVFGVTLEQRRNDRLTTPADFSNIVTQNKEIQENAIRDMLIASITLKYTQSNSVCFAADGQVIGVGAGQQSRVHCTRLAGAKADLWRLRQHPRVLALAFKPDVKRPARDNAIDQFLQPEVTDAEKTNWSNIFMESPCQLTAEERRAWLDGMSDVVLGSDAFFPFRDSIDRASKSGVKYVVQPGGSNHDEDVIAACNEYGMTMVFSAVRLFHH
jgi:phosphoribosylaminoimidazolecarboxamide formyltransferase / IMP cyclohydrolase